MLGVTQGVWVIGADTVSLYVRFAKRTTRGDVWRWTHQHPPTIDLASDENKGLLLNITIYRVLAIEQDSLIQHSACITYSAIRKLARPIC